MQLQQQIEKKLRERFSPDHIEVINDSSQHRVPEGAESHFTVILVSKAFAGLSRLQRQKAVFSALGSEMKGGIHALAQKIFTPEEWEIYEGELKPPKCAHK